MASGNRDWRDGGLRGYWRGRVFHCEGEGWFHIMTYWCGIGQYNNVILLLYDNLIKERNLAAGRGS